ncbi:MAG: peptide-methionine (S)-S-oxide reductase MsrA [Proteobacteria bacterium]|nr:peptide-methionine (S)-S-oxide reductase MsrA [Burkholderiales bacterium]
MNSPAMQVATLGGGCFWCVEAVFDDLIGVESVESGYMGGHVDNPTYAQVCSAKSGHAEVIQITFDPAQVTFRDILAVFFTIHDPTTLNRQGNDSGPQYRSVIFYHSDAQKREAETFIGELTAKKEFPRPIVTEISAATKFWIAENYHQEYFAHHGHEPYCQMVVAPKVAKFRKVFADRRKSK